MIICPTIPPLSILFLLVIIPSFSCCKSSSFEVSIQQVSPHVASGGSCYPSCPVLRLHEGENTTFNIDTGFIMSFPDAGFLYYGSCPDLLDYSSDWCQNITYSYAPVPLNISQELSLLYESNQVCGQMMESMATVYNSSMGELRASVTWKMERQCHKSEEDVTLLDFRFMLWDLSQVGGENGANCKGQYYWLNCDDTVVQNILVWGGTAQVTASLGLLVSTFLLVHILLK